jgi:pimeloyl-ACP methyl ester carboxylesterase
MTIGNMDERKLLIQERMESMKGKLRFIAVLFVLVFGLALLSACSVLQPSPTPLVVDTKVDVGGRGLYIFCDGQGSPTVVFDSGFGGDGSYWETVFQETIQYTSACIYDRANLGRSDTAPNPRSTQDMVDDLHHLLVNAQIPGPYLLVGHSMGGMTVLLYASQYPKDVGGIVLVDPSIPDQDARFLAALPTESAGEAACLKEERKLFQEYQKEFSWGAESMDMIKSNDQVRAIQSLEDIPFTLISAGVTAELSCYPPAADAMHQIWLDLHKEYLKLSSDSKQVIVEDSDHFVMYDRPDTIIQAIRERVDEVRYAKKNKKQPQMYSSAVTPNPTAAPNHLPWGFHDGQEGQIHWINCQAEGWVNDPDDPEIDLNVRVLSDGVEVASQVANIYQEGLGGACPGGTCAFNINLSDLISHDQEHSILVQAQDLQTKAWITIFTSPKRINCK